MTGKEHQGKGYGGDALEQIIEIVKNLPEKPARLRLSYEPDNTVAEKFMQNMDLKNGGDHRRRGSGRLVVQTLKSGIEWG